MSYWLREQERKWTDSPGPGYGSFGNSQKCSILLSFSILFFSFLFSLFLSFPFPFPLLLLAVLLFSSFYHKQKAIHFIFSRTDLMSCPRKDTSQIFDSLLTFSTSNKLSITSRKNHLLIIKILNYSYITSPYKEGIIPI